ncbi:MAG: FAD-dependent oxidoreductase [Ignavibacteriae bacterium]|nr:FAD-dependent oxidoreductase [Ignavibacteriota bacterium]
MYRTTNKIIVVGGNAAGPAAAAKAKRVNPDAEVILIESGEFISTGTCELPYLISNEIDDYKKIVFFTPDFFYKSKGVKVFANHYVKRIDAKYKELEVVDKLTNTTIEFQYDKLILTTGSQANELPDLPFTLENVFSLKSVKNYLQIENYLKNIKSKNVLIIGSGYIGLEVADAFKQKGFSVTTLDQEELPMPSADDEIRHLIEDSLIQNDIIFLTRDEQSKFIISDNKLKQYKHEGRFIDFDLAIVAAGIKPNNDLAETANLKIGKFGGLIVDNRLKTSNPNIYAAGDNIEIKNKISNRNDYIPLATYAQRYGHIAGENAAGGNQISEPVILNSAFKLFDNFIVQVGLTSKQVVEHNLLAETVTAVVLNKVKVMPDSRKVFGKIIYDKNSKLILGASFIGSNEVAGYADIISSMIYNKNSALSLAKIDYNYTPPLSPFINLLSVLGRKIQESN